MMIHIVSPLCPPYGGGIGNVAFYHAKFLKDLGIPSKIYTPNYREKKTIIEDIDGISVVRIKPTFTYGNAAIVWELRNVLPQGSFVHLHYPFFGSAEIICFLKKKLKIKLLLHYHMDVVGNGWKKFLFSLHKKIFLQKVIHCADKVIVTSFDYAQNSDIRHILNKSADKFIELPCGVDTQFFKPSKADEGLLKKHQLYKKKVILFVGSLDRAHYFKGLEYLISAMKNITVAKLLIVGDGDQKNRYEKYVADSNLNDRIIFVGHVSQQELPKYYNLSAVVVLPSIDKSEAFGLVILEAAACGKPAVVTRLPGVQTVVENGVTGLLVEPKDIKELAFKINMILSDDHLLLAMGENARRRAAEKYDWRLIVKELVGIYKELFYGDSNSLFHFPRGRPYNPPNN